MEVQNWGQINADMQRGYTYAKNNESVQACREWKKTWSAIVSAMNAGGFSTIGDFDEVFGGLQSVFNWASDYDLELMSAIEENVSFAKERISFCTECLDRVADKNELNSLNMKSSIASSFFRLGMVEDGEERFNALTSENPEWGWGWIHWSDEYSYYAEVRDYGKAIELLNTALSVDGVDEIAAIKERLKEAYEGCGMLEEANSIVIDEWDYGVPLSEIGNIASAMKNELDAAVNEIFGVPTITESNGEVGRNEPCPCGSGKKYKKCCGF